MYPAEWAIALSLSIFVGVIACLETGFRLGCRDSSDTAHEGTGALEAAVFALLGLLLGFSLAGGMSRLDHRRDLIVQEANAIGTAYLRLDLIATGEQAEIRRLFREYLNVRLQAYEKLPDLKQTQQALAQAAEIQQRIWSQAVKLSRPDSTTERLLLPAINEMIDITTARTVALETHLPTLILMMLSVVTLLSGLLAGYTMAKRKRRSWLHILAYAAVIAVTIYAVVDLDNPRSGLIRLDAADEELIKLRNSVQ